MSRLLYGALLLTMIALLACTGEEPTLVPTATLMPTSVPLPTPTAVPTPTPAPTLTPTPTPTPRPTSTPAPTVAPQQQVPAGAGVAPLPRDNPQALLAELSRVELTCIVESSNLQRSITVLQAPEEASPEEIQELLLCLRDGTVLRLFLSGLADQVGPLSGETLACLSAALADADLRSILSEAAPGGEEEGQITDTRMLESVWILALSCLNEDEWAVAAPAVGMSPGDHEKLQCVASELDGPEGMAAVLNRDGGGPAPAFFTAATECGISALDLPAIAETETTDATGGGAIVPINLHDPGSLLAELSPDEQSCALQVAGPGQLSRVPGSQELFPGEAGALVQCFEDETLLRIFITGLLAPDGPLTAETSSCIRRGLAVVDLRLLMSSGAEGDDQNAMLGEYLSATIASLSCLNDAEWRAADATLGGGLGQRESAQCALEKLGGADGLAAALQSEDGSGFIDLLTTAIDCGLQLTPGDGPGG